MIAVSYYTYEFKSTKQKLKFFVSTTHIFQKSIYAFFKNRYLSVLTQSLQISKKKYFGQNFHIMESMEVACWCNTILNVECRLKIFYSSLSGS